MKSFWEDQTHHKTRGIQSNNEKYADIDGLKQEIKQLQSDNCELRNTIQEIENNKNQIVLQQQRHTNHITFYTRNR